jgi:uncharacterized lipoprotein NlpE involved in copper resistance
MKIKILISACLCLISCKKEVKVLDIKTDSISRVVDTVFVDSHNSRNSLDVEGSYKGTIPCADCDGIETEIILNKGAVFIIKTKYLGKSDKTIFVEKGIYSWNEAGSIITLNGLKGKPTQYKVGENILFQLDMEGNIIDGALADKYVLKK